MDNEVNLKVASFFSHYRKQEFKKGNIIIRADEDPTGIYYLEEGVVRQYYVSKNGEEITLNMFKPRAFFPMSWAISDMHNNYYFETMTNSTLYKAPKDEVLQFITKDPRILLDLLKRVYVGIEGLWMHIEYLSAGDALTKLISTLIILAKRFGKEKNGEITIQMKITEKELAEYAGIYRETVSREFQVLKKKELVSYLQGYITIPNMQKLEDELTL